MEPYSLEERTLKAIEPRHEGEPLLGIELLRYFDRHIEDSTRRLLGQLKLLGPEGLESFRVDDRVAPGLAKLSLNLEVSIHRWSQLGQVALDLRIRLATTHFSTVTKLFYDLFEMFETGRDPRSK